MPKPKPSKNSQKLERTIGQPYSGYNVVKREAGELQEILDEFRSEINDQPKIASEWEWEGVYERHNKAQALASEKIQDLFDKRFKTAIGANEKAFDKTYRNTFTSAQTKANHDAIVKSRNQLRKQARQRWQEMKEDKQ